MSIDEKFNEFMLEVEQSCERAIGCKHERVQYKGFTTNKEGRGLPIVDCLNCNGTLVYRPQMRVIYGRQALFYDLSKGFK